MNIREISIFILWTSIVAAIRSFTVSVATAAEAKRLLLLLLTNSAVDVAGFVLSCAVAAFAALLHPCVPGQVYIEGIAGAIYFPKLNVPRRAATLAYEIGAVYVDMRLVPHDLRLLTLLLRLPASSLQEVRHYLLVAALPPRKAF